MQKRLIKAIDLVFEKKIHLEKVYFLKFFNDSKFYRSRRLRGGAAPRSIEVDQTLSKRLFLQEIFVRRP